MTKDKVTLVMVSSEVQFENRDAIEGKLRDLLVDSTALSIAVLVLVGLILLASVVGLFISYDMPAQTEKVVDLEYEQQGTFDYNVRLKPNDLFNDSDLEARQVLFSNLVERIDVTYTYNFSADQPVKQQQYKYEILTQFGTPGLWEKERLIVHPMTTSEPNFSVTFSISISEHIALINTFQEQTGARLDPAKLTFVARVQPEIDTVHGPINEPFEHRLTFSFEGMTIRRETGLENVAPGSFTQTKSIPMLTATQARWLRTGLVAGIVGSTLMLAGAAWLWTQGNREIDASERELVRAQKRVQGLLVGTDELPPMANGHVVVQVSNLDDLLDLADGTLRPVIYSPNGKGYVYCTIDGASGVRYIYRSKEEEAQNKTARGQNTGAEKEAS
jgi:hypothetical protein